MHVTAKMSTEKKETSFFIKFPLLKNFFSLTTTLIFTNFLFNFFLGSYLYADSSSIQVNYETLFIENLMLRDGGLFTLLGSKPMILFNITDDLERTEEEFIKGYQEEKESLEKAKQEPSNINVNIAIPTYKEFKEKQLWLREKNQFRERKKIWEEWVSKRGCISTPIYKLIAREIGNDKWGLFINVLQMHYFLNKYHNEFAQIVQVEFDPNTIIDSIGNETNVFWQKVFKNHFLLGLLLGYGEKNAYLFDWIRRNSVPLESIVIHLFPATSRLECHTTEIFKKNVTIADLVIPYFASFEIDDQELERYVKEKKKIVSFISDQELVPFVLKCFQISG